MREIDLESLQFTCSHSSEVNPLFLEVFNNREKFKEISNHGAACDYNSRNILTQDQYDELSGSEKL